MGRADAVDVRGRRAAARVQRRSDVRGAARAWAVAACAVLALAPVARAAGDETLSLETIPNASVVHPGDVFQIDVVLTVKSQAPVQELSLPDLSAFELVRQSRSTSTAIEMAGGRRQVVVTYRFTYLVRSTQVGVKMIGEASARLGKETARAQPVRIRVEGKSQGVAATPVPDSVAPAPPPPSTVSGASDPSVRFQGTPPAFFLDVRFDKAEVFVGEQVNVTAEVWASQPLSEWPRLPGWKPNGFWVENVDQGAARAPTRRTLGGRSYDVYRIGRLALFPIAPGPLSLDAMQIALSTGGGLFTRGADVSVKSEIAKVLVKPLPDAGRPAGFHEGNVGAYALTVDVRPKETSVGQPFTLKLTAQGRGNIAQLKLPAWDAAPSTLRVFPPALDASKSVQDGVLAGRAEAEMLVQPMQPGVLTVPSFTLAYFDPETGAYQEARTEPVQVVVRAAGAAGRGGVSSSGGGKNVLPRAPRPLHAPDRALPIGDDGLVLGAAALFFIGTAMSAAGAARRRWRGAPGGKRAAATKERKDAFERARQQGDLGALQRIVTDAVADRCGADVKAMPTASLGAALVQRGLPADDARRVAKFVEDVEGVRYAPGPKGDRARLFGEGLEILARLSGARP